MREYVKSRNWETNLVGTDIEECWTKLKDKLYLLRDKFVPLSKKVKNKSKWVTNRVIKFRRAKTKAWNNYVKGGRYNQLYDIYKKKLRESVSEKKEQRKMLRPD